MSGGVRGLGLSDDFINIRKPLRLNKSGVFYLAPEVMYYEENSGGSFSKTKK